MHVVIGCTKSLRTYLDDRNYFEIKSSQKEIEKKQLNSSLKVCDTDRDSCKTFSSDAEGIVDQLLALTQLGEEDALDVDKLKDGIEGIREGLNTSLARLTYKLKEAKAQAAANKPKDRKTLDGYTCAFPFKYKGTTYRDCTKAGYWGFDSSYIWCARSVAADLSYSNWGWCKP